jgi:uncharacterized iron-regulated membrane protein
MTPQQPENTPSTWQQWMQHPQRQPLRRALFQIHLWSGIGLGLYIFFISVTGSVLVYRNELYEIFTPQPYISSSPGPALSDEALTAAAVQAHPGYRVIRLSRHYNPGFATDIWLENAGGDVRRRHFDPNTGEDVGSAVAVGIMLVSGLIEIHDNFLAGETGQNINGIGAMAVVLVAMTGLVIWWPGRQRWRRSLTLHKNVGWKRFNWDLHSMMGFWTFAFIMIFSLSGIYLCYPEHFHAWADRTFEITDENAGQRPIDRILYWMAFSHFGRINGIGLFCDGPGLCDQATKATWAVFGMAPAAMFITGTIMWWNRVLRRWLRRA